LNLIQFPLVLVLVLLHVANCKGAAATFLYLTFG
jgi:hypothetical protein